MIRTPPMTPTSRRALLRPLRCAALAGLALALAGCANKLQGTLLPDQLPEVLLTAAPANSNNLYFYSYTLEWTTFDPDGRVQHCVYAVDPPPAPGADTSWTVTRDHHVTLQFHSGDPAAGADSLTLAADHHTFVIAAVDDRGAMGPRVHRSFFSFTQAPTVMITNPHPSALLTRLVVPTVRIAWTGEDPDGLRSKKPVRYKYTLLGPSSQPTIADILVDPGILKRRDAPEFPAENGWVEVGGETNDVVFTNLTPGADYLFVIVAFDEAGAYSPIFSLESSMVRFRVTYAGTQGPRLSLFNEFFNYTYAGGGYSLEERFWVKVEIPIDTRITINWSAVPPSGAQIRSYRWSLDNQALSDDTPREDEETDLAHWSQASLQITKATVGPFRGATQQHFFYVEAEDNLGLRSLGIVALMAVQGTFDRPLLIVDDTRRNPDGIQANGQPTKPIGPWPVASELDTFLYARGGVPWKNMPAGTQSPPGLFSGYDFDTLGTRLGQVDLSIPLFQLGRYRHVVWIVDGKSATFAQGGTHLTQPQTSLYYMSSAGRANTLGAYAAQGGKLWLAGGGVAFASQFPTNNRSNDRPTITFSAAAGELVPGRFMYEYPEWRSEIRTAATLASIRRYTGRFEGTGSAYDLLPSALEPKSPGSDPLYQCAPGRNATDFYLTAFDVEFLHQPNVVVEDYGPNPDHPEYRSVLDTLYQAEGTSLPPATENPHNVIMSWYHGHAHEPVAFSGFSLWSFKREQCKELVDFVLQALWGLSPTGPAAQAARARPAPNTRPATRAARVPAGRPAARDHSR